MLKRIAALAVMVLALAPLSARAQRPGRDALREKIREFRVARIMEVLALDPQTQGRLRVVVDKAYDDIAAITRDSGAARRELRALLDTDRPDDTRVNTLVDRLIANKAKLDAVQADLIREVRRVLAPRQAGRLVLALPEIERQITQRIRRATEEP